MSLYCLPIMWTVSYFIILPFFPSHKWAAESHVTAHLNWASQMAQVIKNPPANAGDIRDTGSIPGWGRSHGRENDNPLQYSCPENPKDKGAWWATVHGVTQSRT